jgi:hypothetical protein
MAFETFPLMFVGIIALADGIKNNGALTKLDIGRNGIPIKQERELQRICVAGGVELSI